MTRRKAFIYFALLITGAGIGWLVGLSVSPVISIVITSVVGSAAAIIAAASGLEGESASPPIPREVDPWPIAFLVIGLVGGSIGGVRARTYDWLEPDISQEMAKWTSVGISEEKIRNELFNAQFSLADTGEISNSSSSDEGVLFAVGAEECDSLRGKSGDELKRELETSTSNPELQQLPEIIQDVDVLEELVKQVLCPD